MGRILLILLAIAGVGLLAYSQLKPKGETAAAAPAEAVPAAVLAQADALSGAAEPQAMNAPAAEVASEAQPAPAPASSDQAAVQMEATAAEPVATPASPAAAATAGQATPAQVSDARVLECAQLGSWGIDDCPTLEQLISRFSRDGSVAFTEPPTQMRLGQTYTIRAAASVGTAGAEEAVRAESGDAAPITTQNARLLPTLEASLEGRGFEITPMQSAASQTLLTDQPTEWAWEVKPTEEGEKQLTLIVWGSLTLQDVQPIRVQTVRHAVTVTVDWPARFDQAREWVLVHWDATTGVGAIALAGIGWFGGRWRRRKLVEGLKT